MKNKKIGVFDIEAVDWNKFYMGGIYDGINYYIYDDINKLFDKLIEYDYIFGFFNSKYDNNFILERLFELGLDSRFLIVNGKMIYLKIGKTKIKDLWKFTHTTLEKSVYNFIGKHIGKTKIDYKNIDKLDREIVKNYLKNDLLITYELYKKLDLLFDVKKHYSISSIALKTIKKESGIDFIYRKENQKIENSIETYGGRVDIFRKKGENIFVFDVNSFYPSIFYNYNIPYDIETEINPEDIETMKFLMNKKEILLIHGIYRDNETIPEIPVKNEKGELFYLLGDKEQWYYSDCIDLNRLKKINRVYLMKKYDKKNFKIIKKWYELKKKNYSYKILLNSFYGKMLQKPLRDKYKIVYDVKELQKLIEKEEYELLYENQYAFILSKKVFNPYLFHNRFIGKYITDKTRSILTRDIKILLNNNIKVYYCDTDSIHTERRAEKFLNTGNNIGEYKLEYIVDSGIYNNPKDYRLILKNGKKIEKFKGGKGYINMSIKNTLKKNKFEVKEIKKENRADYTRKKRLDKRTGIYYYYSMEYLNTIN